MAKLNTSQKLAAGRLWAAERMPYMRVGLFSLVAHEWDAVAHVGFPTMAVTDDGVLLVDNRALAQWDVAEVGSVLLHELCHVIRDHSGRAKTFCVTDQDRKLWNFAADCEINDDLAAAKLKLPEGGVYPKSFGLDDGLTAEAYYAAMRRMAQAGEAAGSKALAELLKQAQADQDGAGEGEGEGGKSGEGSGEGKAKAAGGQCGSGAGNKLPGEPEKRAQGKTDPSDNAPLGRSPAQIEAVRRQVAEAIRNEVEQKGRGNVPGGFVRWAEEVLGPSKVDWRSKLSRAARHALAYRPGAVDYRMDRPSRRQSALGYGPGKPILPALRFPVPNVHLYIDTSGSMGADDLGEALREVNGVLKAVGANLTLWVGDADVHGGSSQIRSIAEVRERLVGGGGTDFRPLFERLSAPKNRPDVLIMLTDGDGWTPDSPPAGYRVVWVIVGTYRRLPQWGDIIEVQRDAA